MEDVSASHVTPAQPQTSTEQCLGIASLSLAIRLWLRGRAECNYSLRGTRGFYFAKTVSAHCALLQAPSLVPTVWAGWASFTLSRKERRDPLPPSSPPHRRMRSMC